MRTQPKAAREHTEYLRDEKRDQRLRKNESDLRIDSPLRTAGESGRRRSAGLCTAASTGNHARRSSHGNLFSLYRLSSNPTIKMENRKSGWLLIQRVLF